MSSRCSDSLDLPRTTAVFRQSGSTVARIDQERCTFRLGTGVQTAFEDLKRLLTSSPVLAFPDFTRGFILEMDASGTGLGSVLAQEK